MRWRIDNYHIFANVDREVSQMMHVLCCSFQSLLSILIIYYQYHYYYVFVVIVIQHYPLLHHYYHVSLILHYYHHLVIAHIILNYFMFIFTNLVIYHMLVGLVHHILIPVVFNLVKIVQIFIWIVIMDAYMMY